MTILVRYSILPYSLKLNSNVLNQSFILFFCFNLDYYPYPKDHVILLEYLKMLPFLIQTLIVFSNKKNNSPLNN